MRLFNRDDAAIGPGFARNGIERRWKIGNPDGELLLACSYRTDHRALSVLRGVSIRH